jgi:hypothetical protein
MKKISVAQSRHHTNHYHYRHHHQSEALKRAVAVCSVSVAKKTPGVQHKGPIIFK